jgi:hypothetical protein
MNLQTEVYISRDELKYEKIDLANNESINMKYILKDTTDLSKIFSPYSLAFTFPGTLNNQRIFGFVGNTSVFKIKKDNTFSCKIYSNGLLAQSGKLKITEVEEEYGVVQAFTANFTTTMLSLATRMGDDLISDLPATPIQINWSPNEVFSSLSSVKTHVSGVKYYVPLISNNRVFQREVNTEETFLDNVRYVNNSDPLSASVIKSDELTPAIQGRAIIDLIKTKYNLDVEMPLEDLQYYNDWFVFCNAEKTQSTNFIEYDITIPFTALERYRGKNTGQIPALKKYTISADLNTNVFEIAKAVGASNDFNKEVKFYVQFSGISSTKGNDNIKIEVALILQDGNNTVFSQLSMDVIDFNAVGQFIITDNDFLGANNFTFKVQTRVSSPIVFSSSETRIEYGFYDAKFGAFNQSAYGDFRQRSRFNLNSIAMSLTNIDLFKSLPAVKCVDFLKSFYKSFNISIFDASPNDDKLYWVTPQDLLVDNKSYSKKVVDYTPYISSRKVIKEVPNKFNYYNFKHATSNYRSNVDFRNIRGFEFGQLNFPVIKPAIDLNEYAVETTFSLLPMVSIVGMPDEFTSYAFTAEAPTVSVDGFARYKPNYDELTVFFNSGLRNLVGDKSLGFQTSDEVGVAIVSPLLSYIKTSPIHSSGFSFGFGLIQDATTRSLYADFYQVQTERLLNPNTLKQEFELILPASELVLNYATTTQGNSLVPDGYRLQNEIILQENRFSQVDAQIDITTGNTKIKLLNF